MLWQCDVMIYLFARTAPTHLIIHVRRSVQLKTTVVRKVRLAIIIAVIVHVIINKFRELYVRNTNREIATLNRLFFICRVVNVRNSLSDSVSFTS